MFFFISYYLIRSFIGTSFWVLKKSYHGIEYLVVNYIPDKNQKKEIHLIKDKEKDQDKERPR